MSASSTRRKLRDVRRSFTGEDKPTAEAGVGRGGLGLDACTPQQRRFRALLAVHLFNANVPRSGSGPGCVYSAQSFLSYTMVVSPQYKRLLFILPRAVDNARGRLMSGSEFTLDHGIPGLRVVAASGVDTFHVVHLPTGAKMVLTNRSNYEPETAITQRRLLDGQRNSGGYLGTETPLASVEEDALRQMPQMTPEVESILAALVSRLNACDPQRQWATGNWWTDPLRRPKPIDHGDSDQSFLWGSGDEWELRWDGHPYPKDIASCLTDPSSGLAGVVATQNSVGWRITLGHSSLSLRYGTAH